jgi:hypothetical protein
MTSVQSLLAYFNVNATMVAANAILTRSPVTETDEASLAKSKPRSPEIKITPGQPPFR